MTCNTLVTCKPGVLQDNMGHRHLAQRAKVADTLKKSNSEYPNQEMGSQVKPSQPYKDVDASMQRPEHHDVIRVSKQAVDVPGLALSKDSYTSTNIIKTQPKFGSQKNPPAGSKEPKMFRHYHIARRVGYNHRIAHRVTGASKQRLQPVKVVVPERFDPEVKARPQPSSPTTPAAVDEKVSPLKQSIARRPAPKVESTIYRSFVLPNYTAEHVALPNRERWCQQTKPQLDETLGLAAQDFQSAGKVACVEPMDLEAPGNLARVLEARSFRREVVMLVTDLSQSDLALNMVLNLRQLGVEHYILITTEAEDARLCHRLRALVPDLGCVWTTFEINKEIIETEQPPRKPLPKTYRIWSMRKHYLAVMAAMRFNVFQCDTDVVWQRNPYPVLKTLLGAHNLLHQREVGHTVNGGVVYVQNAHPSGPVVWALQEMERRVRARARNPFGELEKIIPASLTMAVLEQARPITRIDSEISDEQDLLNDVVAGSCLDRDVHFHATRVLIFNTVRDSPDWPTQEDKDKAREHFVNVNQPEEIWRDDDTHLNHTDLVPEYMCKVPASATRMKHCKMHSVAQPTTVNETAVQVPEWVFAAHGRAVVQYALNDCEGRQPQRATWQERPSSTQTHVWHTVGAPGSKEVRRLLMRFFGAWHYFPVDARGGEAVFPLDGTRVLALAPTYPASGLSFSSHKNVRTALRRLGMLAAATGRVAVHPMLDAATLSLPLQPEVEGFTLHAPCPGVNTTCCVWASNNCDRHNLVYPPEVSFLLPYLDANETATVDASVLFDTSSHAEASRDSNSSGWFADEWRATFHNTLSEDFSSSFWRFKQAHQHDSTPVVYLKFPDLELGNGDQLLRELPSGLRCA